MKFLALLKKELRECLPVTLGAAAGLVFFGVVTIRAQILLEDMYVFHSFTPASAVSANQFIQTRTLSQTAPCLLLSSLGLGLVLAVVQFCVPNSTRTWAFLLHRSLKRQTILWAKLTAALICIIVALGPLWIIFYWYASRPGVFIVAPTIRVLIEGLVIILLASIAYLGTALVGISTAHWYTTRIFGLAFATLIVITTLVQPSISWALLSIAAGALILFWQITERFVNRQF
jgi:hypothetical protein